jgi:hypothetical protein
MLPNTSVIRIYSDYGFLYVVDMDTFIIKLSRARFWELKPNSAASTPRLPTSFISSIGAHFEYIQQFILSLEHVGVKAKYRNSNLSEEKN